MEKEAGLALKYWPLWSLGAVLVCIAYVCGNFHYPGLRFLTLLSFSDYVSLSLPALPYILFVVLANLVMSDDPTMKEIEERQRFEEYEKAELAKPAEERSWNKRRNKSKRYELVVSLLTPTMITTYWVFSNWLPPEWAWVSFIYLGLACIGLLWGFWSFAVKRHLALGLSCIGAFAVLGVAYSTGLYAGAEKYTRRPDTIVHLGDQGSICVNVVTMTGQGPLVVRNRETVLIAWNQVERMSRTHSRVCQERARA